MKKMKRIVLVFLLILALIIQHFNIVDVTKAADTTERKLKAGDYMYINPVWSDGDWTVDSVDIVMWHATTGSSWKYTVFTEWDGLLRAKLPSDINTDGEFVLARVTHNSVKDGSNIWVNAHNQTGNLTFSSNTNTINITGWGSASWATGEDAWITSNYAGKTLYFYNIDGNNNPITEVNTIFQISSNTSTTFSEQMTRLSDNHWSVTIPSGADYDKVFFYESGNLLAETLVLGGDYDPDGNNTFYYNISTLSDTTTVSKFGEKLTATDSIAGKRLFFDKTDFVVGSGNTPTIQIGNGEVVNLSKYSDDNTVYTYTIPQESNATSQTVITVTDDGNRYNFFWSDFTNNSVTLENNIAGVRETYSEMRKVYFDATLSKLGYSEVWHGNNTDFRIPRTSGNVYYYVIDTDGSKPDIKGLMTKSEVSTIGNNTFSDVYEIRISTEYDKIVFSGFEMSNSTNYGGYGESTSQIDIPWSQFSEPCFYADTSDSYIYDSGTRGGYWANKGVVRDPDVANGDSEVVDIPKVKQEFANDTLYINSTFYDYYSDYELNGKNRDNYNESCDRNSHRIYQPFRQFNQALSSYYNGIKARWPLYWGNFQNYAGNHYGDLDNDLPIIGIVVVILLIIIGIKCNYLKR